MKQVPLWVVCLVGFLLAGKSAWAVPTISPTEVEVPFAVGPIKSDPVRNMVFLVDATNARLLAIDMTTGQQVAEVTIDDGATQGELAVSIDDNTLYLSETNENEIMAFSLPDLTPLPTLSIGFPARGIASGVSGRLFASNYTGPSTSIIVEIKPVHGRFHSILWIVGKIITTAPLLRTNFDGTNLYAGVAGIKWDA